MACGIFDKNVYINSVAPQSCAGAVSGRYISLKNQKKIGILIALGAITTSVTIQLRQATAVAGTGVKALNFDHVWRTGGKLAYTVTAGALQVGEVITGTTSAATAKIHQKFSTGLVIYSISGTFQSGETITGTTSAATGVLTSAVTEYGMKCRVAMAAAANTIALTIPNETYCIDVLPETLDVANGFDCIMADISAVGGTSLAVVSYILDPKYKEEPQKSPIID